MLLWLLVSIYDLGLQLEFYADNFHTGNIGISHVKLLKIKCNMSYSEESFARNTIVIYEG